MGLVETEVMEREEVFPPLPGEELPVTEHVHVMEAQKRIKHWTEKKAVLEKEALEVLDFYRRWYEKRQNQCEERITFNIQQITAYMDATGQTKVPTPEGTAYFKMVTRKEWPEDTVLVAFAQQAEIPGAVKTKHSPDKRVIYDYIKGTGDVPEGFVEREERVLQLRQANRNV
jgi:hypothetical protein